MWLPDKSMDKLYSILSKQSLERISQVVQLLSNRPKAKLQIIWHQPISNRMFIYERDADQAPWVLSCVKDAVRSGRGRYQPITAEESDRVTHCYGSANARWKHLGQTQLRGQAGVCDKNAGEDNGHKMPTDGSLESDIWTLEKTMSSRRWCQLICHESKAGVRVMNAREVNILKVIIPIVGPRINRESETWTLVKIIPSRCWYELVGPRSSCRPRHERWRGQYPWDADGKWWTTGQDAMYFEYLSHTKRKGSLMYRSFRTNNMIAYSLWKLIS